MSTNKSQDQESKKPSSQKGIGFWLPAALVGGVAIAWVASGYVVWHQFPKMSDRGTFGDMFGSINSLFSGLAFAGLIIAILLQHKELQLQRDELSLTRGELSGQREQLKAQNDTLKRQTFENTFFQLLRLHNEIVAAIDLRSSDDLGQVIAQGRDCFKSFYTSFKQRAIDYVPPEGTAPAQYIEDVYVDFYPIIEAELGHYFRSLYNIVKFIDGSLVDNKRLYTNLVRAQISKYELLLLLYNVVSSKGSDKFLPLMKKYDLLKMVQANELLAPGHERLVRGGSQSTGNG